MKTGFAGKKCPAVKLAAVLLCVFMLAGCIRVPAFAAGAEDPGSLAGFYCSQTVKDRIEEEKLQELVDAIVTSIEPQAVNLLIESFPCFREAAEKDGLGREIGLYIYYEKGDQDGIGEHEAAFPGSYAAVKADPVYHEDGSATFNYMIYIDVQALIDGEANDDAVLDLDGPQRVQLDTTFCHELFHALMFDYNRAGMSGYTDIAPYRDGADSPFTEEEGTALSDYTHFPFWFIEGLAGCVGNIYQADLVFFNEYHYDPATQEYLDACTKEQLLDMYIHWNSIAGVIPQRYDLEDYTEDDGEGLADGSVYVSGYLACLYLADLECREREGAGAMTFGPNGGAESISSEKLRAGISGILSRLHRGDTLDEVIREISGGAYQDTDDFVRRFVKGAYHEETEEYEGDPESLSFCVGFLNYMSRLDALDPETHPAGSLLMDDFGSTRVTPLEKDKEAASDFYRFVGQNVLVPSTVSCERATDGGTKLSGRNSLEENLEIIRKIPGQKEEGAW